MSVNIDQIRSSLVGTWKLHSYVSRPCGQDGPVGYPMGKDVQGYIIYSSDGFMSAQLMTPGSVNYSSEDFLHPKQDEAADAARHYLAYSGPFEILEREGKPVVKHHTDISVVPNWAGHHQLRFCDWRGDELTLGPLEPCIVNVCRYPFPRRISC